MGSLQARMSQGDTRLFNVNRDVAHNFDFVVQEVASCVETGRWPALTQLARTHNVDDTQLGLACQALIKFIGVQTDNPKESMNACLARCGFLDLHEVARMVVMAYLGIVTLGIHHAGVREATMGGVGPALTYKRLRWWGKRFSLLMTMPRWKRRLYRLKERTRRAWRAFFDKSAYDA
jgi:hypothetical protein